MVKGEAKLTSSYVPKAKMMTSKVMMQEGYHLNDSLEKLFNTASNEWTFGLGHKPTKYDMVMLQKQKREKQMVRLEGKELSICLKPIPSLYDTFRNAGICSPTHVVSRPLKVYQ